MTWSIRNRIMVPYLALIITMVGASGWLASRWAADRAQQQWIERGRGIAGTLERSHFPWTEAVLRQLKGLGGVEFAVVEESGHIRAATLPGLPNRAAGPPQDPGRLPPRSDLSFRHTWQQDGRLYRVAIVERLALQSAGSERLLIFLPESTLRAAAWEARRAVLVFSLAGAALAVLLAWWIGQALSRPLSAVLCAVKRIGQGDLEPDGLPLHRQDEIGQLALGVDQMAAWLRRLLEEQEQTQRLRLIQQVSAGLAHELRNPLTAARMTLQLYMERNADRDAEPLRLALDELGRLERQVRRFLQIARPEPPQLQLTHLTPLLERVAASLAATAEHQQIGLSIEPHPDLPPVRIDPEQMGQVLSNLVLNALQAAGPGGHVRLAARRAHDRVAIEVEDDGPGVPPQDQDRLFRPFFTTKPEGVGLGLALCDALVREMEGTIAYHRAAGWTCFRVLLPAAVENFGDGRQPAEPVANGAARAEAAELTGSL